MKKLLILLLLLLALLCHAQEYARMNLGIVGAGGAVALSCGVAAHLSGGGAGDYERVGGSTTETLAGLGQLVPAANFTLCKVVYNAHSVVGDLTGFTFTSYVYQQDGSGDITIASPFCTSTNTVAGNTISAGNSITFNFSGCNLVTTQTNGYAVVLRHDQTENTTNALTIHDDTSSVISGTAFVKFGSTGTRTLNYGTYNPQITLHKME